jgi:phosphoenolpyruvate phosphomutase
MPGHNDLSNKCFKFRQMLVSPGLSFIMEAHSGLSAKIVERSGFEGIWASGLSISTALGLRDSNEASWSQVLEVLEFMSDATNIPIMVDGDTGYGNFNNVRILVKKLCSVGIAAVCIEDKTFPKTNSFISGMQELANIEEFCGKIKAEFANIWQNRCPVVIVPTKYYQTPTERFREAQIAMIIWANHNMRSSIKAMQDTCQKILKEQSLISVETKITSLDEVFSLLNYDELANAERHYLP